MAKLAALGRNAASPMGSASYYSNLTANWRFMVKRTRACFFVAFAALYIFFFLELAFIFPRSKGQQTKCILFVYEFLYNGFPGKRDEPVFVFWLVYEVYKGNGGLLFFMELGIRRFNHWTRQVFGMIWINNK